MKRRKKSSIFSVLILLVLVVVLSVGVFVSSNTTDKSDESFSGTTSNKPVDPDVEVLDIYFMLNKIVF